MTDSKTDASDNHNLIEITDEDGNVVHTIDIGVCNQVADDMLDSMVELEEVMDNFDFVTACFSLFVNCVHILTDHGWSVQELVKEVEQHGSVDQSPDRTLN
jgi:hypothetical protein